MATIDDDNVSWEEELPGWEPFELEEYDEVDLVGGCAYCVDDVPREFPEPFGSQLCCDKCFNILIGGSEDDIPWRCPRYEV